eukprot:4412939-Amphidinium_carterae.1
METEKPNFPIPAGSCKDCGHANVGFPPPGLGTPLPSQVIWNKKWRCPLQWMKHLCPNVHAVAAAGTQVLEQSAQHRAVIKPKTHAYATAASLLLYSVQLSLQQQMPRSPVAEQWPSRVKPPR